MRVCALHDGAAIDPQLLELREGADVLVATPGSKAIVVQIVVKRAAAAGAARERGRAGRNAGGLVRPWWFSSGFVLPLLQRVLEEPLRHRPGGRFASALVLAAPTRANSPCLPLYK